MVVYFSLFDDVDDDIERVRLSNEETEMKSIFEKYVGLFENGKTKEDFIFQYGYNKTICILAFLSEIKELYEDGNDKILGKRYKFLNALH